jgi:hypothetical protein
MKLKDWLYPVEPRFFPGQRWVNITLRSLHLLGVAGMGAGFLMPGIEPEAWRHYFVLAAATGLGMAAIYAWSDGLWLHQLCGQSVLVKLLLLALVPAWPAAGPALFAAVILLSGFVSHAPARVRHFSIYRWRPLERRRGDRPGAL